MQFNRRDFIKALGAAAASGALYGCAGGARASGNVVVVGGGYAGATVAKYLRMWSDGGIDVTLVEPKTHFVSCPMSNLVLAGEKKMDFITHGYDGLRKHGVRVVHDVVVAIDAEKRSVTLARGGTLGYDRLVVSPGIDFMWESVPGLTPQVADSKILHSWQAGPQTAALRAQLEAMPDGGVYALAIPKMPFRCPPGPYERTCMVADYFKKHKPKSKVLVLDANEDVVTKKGIFTKAWNEWFKGIVEYRGNHVITGVDAASQTVKFEFGDAVRADVLNIVPAQKAGSIAAKAGLATAGKRWCPVTWATMESTVHKNIHVLGDSTAATPGMPKSAHTSTQQSRVAAAAIVNLMAGKEAPEPIVLSNACYSFIDAKHVAHIAVSFAYDKKDKVFKPIKAAGGVSPTANELEVKYAMAWAQNIWADTLGG